MEWTGMLQPFEINEKLTNERIDTVGQLLVEAHNEVIDKEETYDNGWSTGCRSYAWRSSKVSQAVDSGEFPWLSIIDGSLRFIFSIGGTPVSMFRGNTDKPKQNILSRATSYPELRQFGLFTELEDIPNLVWSYAMETGPGGEVLSLQFVGLTDFGEVIAQRDVPVDEMLTPLSSIYDEEYKPVSLPAASVSIRQNPRPKTGNEEETEEKRMAGNDDSGR
ncbi:hypothetical protein FWJ25_00750 [Marinobacter salinexigens]|uniref:Uncharacterized protein n=1 Tax=Marinobacter salinexigens TaxID=2919747 RepID=A0A5B0VPC1_9GAMM|nr:hypothetical protein [Marinobacter salinexigens]KAA1175699.1 hypothetical protein FWJ25_00750 [Marinobacter salinexigens]